MEKSSSTYRHIFTSVAVIAFFSAFVWQWWPLSILAIVAALLSERPFLALILATCFDLLYGTSMGVFRALYIPYVACTLFGIGLYAVLGKYILHRQTEYFL